MATAYQKVAKQALIKWNGLSEEDAQKRIETDSIDKLEKDVHAINSVSCAVSGIAKVLDLSLVDTATFFKAAVHGPEDAEILKTISKKIEGLSDYHKLIILDTIHNGWVINNSSEKIFYKKYERNQIRQYAPMELIGWNEVKSDLIFLSPILSSLGISVDIDKLEEAYHQRVNTYLESLHIDSPGDLFNLVSSGKEYYPYLSDNIDKLLKPMSDLLVHQIIDNWNNNDPKTAKMFVERQFSTKRL